MWWSEYQAWHRRNKPRRVYVEATMSDLIDWDHHELTTTPTLTPDPPTMNRCDADHAERGTMKWDSLIGTLLLCPNHSRRHATALHAQGWRIISPSL